MKDRIFPPIAENLISQGRASYEKRCFFQERLLYRYLERKIEGWSVEDFLKKERIENYALYAITDFTTLFLKDLEKSEDGYRQGIICDRNAKAFRLGFMKWPVIYPEELICRYQIGEIEKIIVMSVLHENEIIDELLKKDVMLNDLVPFISILYS